MSSEYQVGPDTFVALDFTVFDGEGEAVSEAERLGFVFGRGQLFPALEQALDGLGTGDRGVVTLAPRDAYGEREPQAILEVDRAEFPPEVAPGDRFEAENDAGAVLVLKVLDVGPDTVHLDLNHPLAGQEVRVEFAVSEVRPATSEELAAADAALEAAQDQSAAGTTNGTPVAAPVIPLDRLLRGRTRGYERSPAGVTPATQPGDSDEH